MLLSLLGFVLLFTPVHAKNPISLGTLTTRAHDVTGEVWLLSDRALEIRNFVYDGKRKGESLFLQSTSVLQMKRLTKVSNSLFGLAQELHPLLSSGQIKTQTPVQVACGFSMDYQTAVVVLTLSKPPMEHRTIASNCPWAIPSLIFLVDLSEYGVKQWYVARKICLVFDGFFDHTSYSLNPFIPFRC